MILPAIVVPDTCIMITSYYLPPSFVQWLYPSSGGEENVESAALGIIILWTTWQVPVLFYEVVYTHVTKECLSFHLHMNMYILHCSFCRFAFNAGSTESIAGIQGYMYIHT